MNNPLKSGEVRADASGDLPKSEQVPESIETLVSRLNDPNSRVRHDARVAIKKRGKSATHPLLALLATPDHQTRWEAAKALSQIADPDTAPRLVKVLADDEDFDIRWLAAEGLIAIGPEGLPSLLQALVNRADSVWLRKGAHHVLRTQMHQGLDKVVGPVLTAMEQAEAQLTVPTAARAALEKLATTAT